MIGWLLRMLGQGEHEPDPERVIVQAKLDEQARRLRDLNALRRSQAAIAKRLDSHGGR